jgi:FAD-dependent urate hydroxylase
MNGVPGAAAEHAGDAVTSPPVADPQRMRQSRICAARASVSPSAASTSASRGKSQSLVRRPPRQSTSSGSGPRAGNVIVAVADWDMWGTRGQDRFSTSPLPDGCPVAAHEESGLGLPAIHHERLRGMSAESTISTEALIIGAGPYGISTARRLDRRGVPYRIVGEPMGFWRRNMPAGMYLRSSWDWHLDTEGELTIEQFLEETGRAKDEVTPFPLSTYLEYVDWLQRGARIEAWDVRVERLDYGPGGRLIASLDSGEQIAARSVVVALGFSQFAHIPPDLEKRLPMDRVTHTVDFVDLERARGRSVLLLGGRQSAFEWAALLCEAGAAAVHIAYRHPSPAFEEADWSWVTPLMEGSIGNPAWYRSLPEEERTAVSRRLWGEGRLKVEPWLKPRLLGGPVSFWPETTVAQWREGPGDRVTVELTDGRSVEVDLIVLATGYKPDVGRIEFLANGECFEHLVTAEGLPVLDTAFQTSIPGLYMTSMLATREFGPFFGFTVACRASATIIGDDVARRMGGTL